MKRRAEGCAAGGGRPAPSRSRGGQPRNFVLDALELRILLSADPITQALADRLDEPASAVDAALFETFEEGSSRIVQASGPEATIRTGYRRGVGNGFELTGSDWTIDLGEEASEGGADGDWLLLGDQRSPGSEHDSEVRNLESPGVSSSQVDRSSDTGQRLGVVAGDGVIDTSSVPPIDGSGEMEVGHPEAAPFDPVSGNLTPILLGGALAASDPIGEFAIQAVGYVEAHYVVTGPPADTQIEPGLKNAVEPETPGPRMMPDDSLARGPPAVDDTLAGVSPEKAPGVDPSSGANPEAGLVLLQEGGLLKVGPAVINVWRSLGLHPALLDRLTAIQFEISGVPGRAVGEADRLTITLDRSAAGVDLTPYDDLEFRGNASGGGTNAIDGGPADGRIDDSGGRDVHDGTRADPGVPS